MMNKLPDIPLTNTFEQMVHIWANFMILARHAMSCDPFILPLRYEDIVSYPRATVTEVFQTLKLNLKHMDTALTALNRDSQRGQAISGDLFKNDPLRQIPVVDRVKADTILSRYNLPLMGEQFML